MTYSDTMRGLVEAVNAEREKGGLPALTMDQDLSESASNWAYHMWKTGRMVHDRLDGFNGENIAWGQENVDEVMKSWMNSRGHRANILRASFTKIGVGRCENYWCQRFI